MYPRIDIGTIPVYIFGIFLAASWVVFFYLLYKNAVKKGITKNVFADIIPFTFSMFFFARVFYIFAQWRTEKFLFQKFADGGSLWDFLYGFFIPANYSLSFVGGVFGFFLVYYLKTRRSQYGARYVDVLVSSFFPAAIIGFFGALLGGQVYGKPFDSIISLSYTNKFSPVAYHTPLFPLPVIYIILVGIGAFASWQLSKKSLPDGYRGYLLMGIFGAMMFLLEFMNGNDDMFRGLIGINLPQILAIIFVIFAFLGISRFLRS